MQDLLHCLGELRKPVRKSTKLVRHIVKPILVLNWYKQNAPYNTPEIWNNVMSLSQLPGDKAVENSKDLRSEQRKSICKEIVDSVKMFMDNLSDEWDWKRNFVSL